MTDPWGSTPPKLLVWCTDCEKTVHATQRGVVSKWHEDQGISVDTKLVSCDVCDRALLFGQVDWGDGYDEPVRWWPDADRPLNPVIPEALRNEHDEARRCYLAKAYTATVVMIRRTLEGVCASHGVNERTLVKSLDKLRDDGRLDARLYDWATELRLLGNDGAHYSGNPVSREFARDALDFGEAMLDYMYVLTARFEGFKLRRQADRQQHNQASTPVMSPES
ncbi:DUF4145 domain-containing protein [Kribbella turkmenica]|uniref:DUF4145 domain-containing protein n=1 Tax=Kribbella turkmenica TaxID=2530375 RepID=A0A4R4XGW2_9ACTN|nr:DUF4145 domain-containing protein [Kribbella turkmenica]TDD29994.1 DUF4145 domain-containing protein [Kribbella turkmenica]